MKKIVTFFLVLLWQILPLLAFVPEQGTSYYILQTATRSAKVFGATSFGEAVIQDAGQHVYQHFEFIPVVGKSNTYFLKNGVGDYLINSEDIPSLTEFFPEPYPGYGEWVLEGTSPGNIRLRALLGDYLGTADFNSGSYLFCDRKIDDVSITLALIPVATMMNKGMVDQSFENATTEGAPLGVWINNNNRILGNDSPTAQNFRSRVVSNGFQSVGNKAFGARFYGDENSYTRISHQLTNLNKGATYRFTHKYKQGNTNNADAFVNTYVTMIPNDVKANAISNVQASVPPSTTATSQAPGTVSVTFFAPADACFVVWEKNPNAASGRNWIYYIDDMELVELVAPVAQIHTETTSFTFTNQNRTSSMLITGVLLTDSIRISAPNGIKVTPSVISPDASMQEISVNFTGVTAVSGNVVLTSGDFSKSIPVTATYNGGLRTVNQQETYYLQQRTSGKVLGVRAVDQSVGLKYADADDLSQQLRFVQNKPDTDPHSFHIINGNNRYLSLSSSGSMYFTESVALADAWAFQGLSDTLVYVTRYDDAAFVMGSDSLFENNLIRGDRTIAQTNTAFILQKNSEVLSATYMFDPDFEFSPFDGGPMGTWIPDNDPLQFGGFGYSRVIGFNNWQSSGQKAFYLRFLGDGASYNAISQKLFNLVPGATYRLDLQYKCQSTSTTSLVNIYAATTANAALSSAIGGVHTTTNVAASNLATQPAQSASLTFVAPARSVWIVYRKNTTSTNYNFYLDNLKLTETIPSSVDQVNAQLPFHAFIAEGRIRVHFENNSTEPIEIRIFNAQGQIIQQNTYELNHGFNEIESGVVNASGLYLVRIRQGSRVNTVKIVQSF